MASRESYCNLFNLIGEEHPQFIMWRRFVFRLHWEVIHNAARLLDALQRHPTSANLSGFTDYVIANGFPGDNANAQQDQDESSEGDDGSGQGNAKLEEAVAHDDNANFTPKNSNDESPDEKQVERRHGSVSDSESNPSSSRVESSTGTDDDDQTNTLARDLNGENIGQTKNKKEAVEDDKVDSPKVSSSSDTEYISIPKIKFQAKELYSSSDSEYEPPKKRRAKKRNFFKRRNSTQVEEKTGSDHTSYSRYQTARKSVHGRGKGIKIQTSRNKWSNQSQQSPQSQEMRRLRKEIQLDTTKWICPNCKKDDFVSKYTRNRHFQTCSEATPTKYQCPVKGCGATFNWSHDLKNHRNEHSKNPKVFTCPYCHQNFLLQKKRIHHIRKYHPKSFMKHFGEAQTESSSDEEMT